jgi:hypothetical protein
MKMEIEIIMMIANENRRWHYYSICNKIEKYREE